MKVHAAIHETANRFPDHIAVYDQEGEMSYRELSDAIHAVASQLRNSGLLPGMVVGVSGKNSRGFIITAIAVMEAGAVVMPLSNQLRPNERDEVISTAGLHAMADDGDSEWPLGDEPFIRLPVSGREWRLGWNPLKDLPLPFAPHVSDPALIRFTSGTTGTAKGVILSHQSIIERIEAANSVLRLGPSDVVLWVLSMAYHFVVSIILYLRYGSAIIICNDFLATALLQKINAHQATFLYVSPMHIRLLAGDKSHVMMDRVTRVISTSTAITSEQCESFQKRFGIPVSQAYGIIELGLPVINLEKSASVPDAIGYATPGYEVEILDDHFHAVPDGVTGNLAMRGPGMLDAYLSPPKKREEILQHGWFMTGDLASRRSDGLIRVEGRKKSMINVAGNKVFPEDVEAVLNRHPMVALSRVSGFHHPLLGESVQAEIVLRYEGDTESLRSYCLENLSPHKVPQKFVITGSLPMTDSGKLKR